MPTVLRVGPLRFFFYANEGEEPPHVHVQNQARLAKFWLEPVALASSTGFAAHELTRLIQLVQQHRQRFLEAWNEFFGS